MDDKLIRKLVIAVLVVVLVLGLLSIVSTFVGLIPPLAILAIGAFAFYKIVLQGRNKPAAMDDEIAETSDSADNVADSAADDDARASSEAAAQERLSAVEQAQSEYLESSSTAEEILDQIKERRQRLQGDDDE